MVQPKPRAKDIIDEHDFYYEKTNRRRFTGNVLGYVTPWNNHGYDIAKIFTQKFTHISPVWLQVKRKGKLQYKIEGKQDIDLKWIEELKRNKKDLKIVPRVLFNEWTSKDYTDLFIDSNEQLELTNTIIKFCKTYKFDGIVLEIWVQVGGSVRSDVLIDFITLVAKTFKSNVLELILVIPPIREYHPMIFTAEHLNKLSDFVTLFSLMTYDYSSPQRPGPNSPINWVQNCVETLVPDRKANVASKILLGLNFYGNDYTVSGGGPIVGPEFIKLLKNYKGKLKLDNDSRENFFEVRLVSLKNTLKLIKFQWCEW